MTLPFATSTFAVKRPGASSEKWEPGTLEDVAGNVPGHLSAGGGSRVTTVGGTETTSLFPLALDLFAGVLKPGDTVVGADGSTWTVVFSQLRPLVEHWQASVRRVKEG